MKKILFLSMMVLVTVSSYGRRHVSSEAVVSSDTLFYAANKMNVSSRQDADYYRLLKEVGTGANKQYIFEDYYLNGTLKAEGGYSFIDMDNDNNTVLDGEITTYYNNGTEKLHGKYVNGKRNGYFTLKMRDGSVAVVQYDNGVSKHDYFTITKKDGTLETRPLSDIKSLLQ